MFLFLAKFQPQNVLNLFLLKYFLNCIIMYLLLLPIAMVITLSVVPYINFVMLQFQDVMFPDFGKLC